MSIGIRGRWLHIVNEPYLTPHLAWERRRRSLTIWWRVRPMRRYPTK